MHNAGVMGRFQQRLARALRLRGPGLYAAVLAIAAAASLFPSRLESPFAAAERYAFDAQMRLLRWLHPRPLADDVVLVGIDEETERRFVEPTALWHHHFADFLHVMARARPRALGVDVVLPERSYDDIVRGLDLALMRGIVDVKRASALVYVQTVDRRGYPVPVQPNLRALLADANLGLDQQLRDPDSVSRRFSERALSTSERAAPTFAGQILRAMGREVQSGYIDYSLGSSLQYIPMHELLEWPPDDPRIAALAGRIVIVGSLVHATDRWQLPAKLLAHDPVAAEGKLAYSQPGVLVHVQTLRSHLAGGLLHTVPDAARWLLMALSAVALFSSARRGTLLAAAVLIPAAVVVASLFSIVALHVILPVAAITLSFWLALVAGGVRDAVDAVADRLRLQQSFAGQVSPAVMKEILDGGIRPGLGGQQAEVCVLFSDVRDFTALSESMAPQVVTTVLQRYFDRMVRAVHRYHGTVDKFIGDGMMVLFGAPRTSPDPCGDAVQCALEMMMELDHLNAEFEREGLPVLTIGIGINYGTVTVGNIGSSDRHNYSAIGDAVNVAARVEGLTKDLGRKIIITEAVVSRLGSRFHFDPLGSHKVKGHSPVTVWGIRTARATTVEPSALEVTS